MEGKEMDIVLHEQCVVHIDVDGEVMLWVAAT